MLWASAGAGKQDSLSEITDEEFDAAFSLNARGTLFTVQKALPLGGRAEGQEDPGERADPGPGLLADDGDGDEHGDEGAV